AKRRRRRWCAIELNGIGKLTAPVIIAAFEGWNDAGEAASGVITHLTAEWRAEPGGAIDPGGYYDFQVTPPGTQGGAGATQRPGLPTNPPPAPTPHPARPALRPRHRLEPNTRP